MKNHRHALLAAVSLLAISGTVGTASAADFEAPSYASWTGFYGAIGGGGRYGFSGVPIEQFDDQGDLLGPIGGARDLGDAGAFGTVELGYDNQFEGSNLVIGVVGNFDFGEALTAAVNETTMGALRAVASWKVDNSWGIGARAGFQASRSTLFYGVAGFTQADITTSVSAGMGTMASTFSDSDWQSGFFVGAGIETRITDQIGAKLEYRYANYDGASVISDTFTTMSATVANRAKADLETHSVRGTLVWRFGNAGAPEAAATLPVEAASWNGFYAAAGVGGRFVFTDIEAEQVDVGNGDTKVNGNLDHFGEPDAFGTVEVGYDAHLGGSGLVIGAVGNFDFAGGASAAVTKTSGMGMGATTVLADWSIGNSWGIGVRAGFQPMDSTLIYGVAGFTQAEIDSSVAGKAGMGKVAPVFSDSDWQSGFFVGAGIETMLTDQVGAKLEYRYANYDGTSVTSETYTTMGDTAVNVSSSGDIDAHSVRATLVWRFGNLGD